MNIKTLLATGLFVTCFGQSPSVHANETKQWQDHESIRAAAERHVQRSVADESNRTVVVANELDSRLKLPTCEGALATDTPYGGTRNARLTVEVACDAPSAWRIYVPVRFEMFAAVVVAAKPLARDTILTTSDLRLEERELGKLTRGYIQDPAAIVGQKLKRALQSGAELAPNLLNNPPAIKRGQIVTVKASSNAISVAMTGTALEDGMIGEAIDITNNSSNRTVQAIVRSARVVEVLLK